MAKKKAPCGFGPCDRESYGKQGLCEAHYQQRQRYGYTELRPLKDFWSTRRLHESGYVLLRVGARGNTSWVYEHRAIMEKHLGRPMLDHETVHHLNGDRQDNRLENLELWSTKQPYGQRVEDKLAYAYEIIRLYGGLKKGTE